MVGAYRSFLFAQNSLDLYPTCVASGSNAGSHLIDYALWMRDAVIEMIRGGFVHHFVPPEDGMAQVSPFEMDVDFNIANEVSSKRSQDVCQTNLWVSPTRRRQDVFRSSGCELI